ncbi:unnamed protein product [Rhizoctonia solani]|uniref:Uncharacterized protein n=1 Tax=Rhizoctonia solani TaxID=456999 RepID=A0A8H3BSK7_9AGAM|nr:unnamed protein product [Rhizoctonia solani]
MSIAGTTSAMWRYNHSSMNFSATKLPNAPRPAPRLATIVESRDTSRVTARWRRNQRPATSVMNLAISPVIALRIPKVGRHRAVAVAEDTAADPTLNATSVARSDTLREPALMQPREGTAEEEEEVARAAIPAVALAICLVIASRGPSATTAMELGTFPRIARNLSGEHAILVAPKGISRVIAPTRAPQLKLMERGEMFSAFNDRSLCLYPSRPHIQA